MSEKFRPLAEDFWVSPQLTIEDVQAAADMGVKLIINNRPDGEAPGQPTGAEIEATAKAAGMTYAYIPVDMGGVTPHHTGALETAMDDVQNGKTVAYCASGMRSALVFAYAEARFGKPVDLIIAQAAEAGYDISGHEPAMTMLFEAHKAPRTDPPL